MIWKSQAKKLHYTVIIRSGKLKRRYTQSKCKNDLPIPIDPWELLYFGATWVVCNVIFGLLPGVSNIPVMIRSIMLPFAISKFLMTKKLDGKNPLRYMLGVITFLFVEQGKSVEFFQTTPDKEATIKLTWNCSEGRI